jgi:hypothetical protein
MALDPLSLMGGSDSSEYSATDALVMFSPHAHGLTPNMLVRGEFTRRVAEKKNVRDQEGKLKPVIVVANPGIRGSNFKLTRAEGWKVRNGDLGPVARELLRSVTVKDFGRVALFGYSEGSDIALAGVHEAYGTSLDTVAVGVGDPVAVKDRGRKYVRDARLLSDFMKAPDFKPSVERTGLEVQQVALGNGMADMIEFTTSGFHPLNLALMRGIGKNTFESQVEAAIERGAVDRIVAAYGENTAIAKPSEIEPALERLHGIDENGALISVKVGGANHTWGDQLTLLAKLYMRAVES